MESGSDELATPKLKIRKSKVVVSIRPIFAKSFKIIIIQIAQIGILYSHKKYTIAFIPVKAVCVAHIRQSSRFDFRMLLTKHASSPVKCNAKKESPDVA